MEIQFWRATHMEGMDEKRVEVALVNHYERKIKSAIGIERVMDKVTIISDDGRGTASTMHRFRIKYYCKTKKYRDIGLPGIGAQIRLTSKQMNWQWSWSVSYIRFRMLRRVEADAFGHHLSARRRDAQLLRLVRRSSG